MKKLLVVFSMLMIVLVSCQKEIDYGTGANDFAELLVKAVQVTPSTNDTNIITFQWNNARQLLVYKSAGKVNGQLTNITHTISRQSDGKITKIITKSSLTVGLVDSIVYKPVYQSGSSRLAYVIDTQYTFLGPIGDSTVYTYAGTQVKTKETFTYLSGSYEPAAKQEYTYDASGNMKVITDSIPDGAGGYDFGGTTTYTYDLHRSMVTLGEESYITVGPANISRYNFTKQEVKDDTGTPQYTTTASGLQFNAADRPYKMNLSVQPQPPGYDLKLTMYYQ